VDVIRLEGIRFAYPGGSPLLQDCCLQVEAGEVVAVAGPNGSGKSTLLRLAAGLLKPQAGSAELAGRPMASWDRVERAKALAYVPQAPRLPEDWLVCELAALGDFPHQERPPAPRPLPERLSEAREALELAPFWERRAGTLSGGEAQRVALARALVQDAPALVLDEPAAHLDLGRQMSLYRFLGRLAARGRAVLISTHDPNLSRLFGQRLLLLNGSGAVKPFPEAEEEQGRLLREVFHVPFVARDVGGVLCWLPDAGEGGEGGVKREK
jgi:iron complex transport system ATP-binding protein